MAKFTPLLAMVVKGRLKYFPTLLLCLFLGFIGGLAQAQSRFEDRKVTLDLQEQSLEVVLQHIGKAAGFELAYNPVHFPVDSIVSIKVVQVNVDVLLEQLLGPNVSRVQSGQHLVIRPLKSSGSKRLPKSKFVVKGVIINQNTGTVLANATVYDVDRLYSALTDSRGYYELEINTRADLLGLTVSKKDYLDTLIIVQPKPELNLNVALKPRERVPDKMPVNLVDPTLLPSRRVEELAVVKFWTPEEAMLQAQNRNYLEPRLGQVSFLPQMGTNRLMSGSVQNTYSLNILAGYSGGVNGIEVGGLVNILRQDMSGIQVAGLSNVLGGRVTGIQVGGLYNTVRKDVNGIQVGGLFNSTGGSVKGLQIGGLFNTSEGVVKGFQIGGLFNQTKGAVQGFQIGGLFNYCGSNVKVMQVGGLFNWGENVGGIQLAGLTNRVSGAVGGLQIGGLYNQADSVGVFQLSGLVNKARAINGLQLAGLINFAQKVQGSQISVINIADTVTGVSIGFLNITRRGYHAVELAGDDVLFANLSLKLGGNDRLYNLFSVGWGSFTGQSITSVGYGLGSLFPIQNSNFKIQAEISSNHLSRASLFDSRIQLLNRARASLAWQFHDNWKLFAGPSLNVLVYDHPNSEDSEWLNEVGVGILFQDDVAPTLIRAWLSGQAGLSYQF